MEIGIYKPKFKVGFTYRNPRLIYAMTYLASDKNIGYDAWCTAATTSWDHLSITIEIKKPMFKGGFTYSRVVNEQVKEGLCLSQSRPLTKVWSTMNKNWEYDKSPIQKSEETIWNTAIEIELIKGRTKVRGRIYLSAYRR